MHNEFFTLTIINKIKYNFFYKLKQREMMAEIVKVV